MGEPHPAGDGTPSHPMAQSPDCGQPGTGAMLGTLTLTGAHGHPLPTIPWVPRKTPPDTANPSPGERGGAQHGGEHWGQQAGTPKSFRSAPKIVAARALGQTGPTGKISQELIQWPRTGTATPAQGTPGHRGTGGLQGHLPACPRAVAARTSRTRSERGCEVLGIFRGGWQRAGARPDPAPRDGLLSHAAAGAEHRHRSLHPGPTSSFYWAQEDKCHQAPWQRGSYNPWEVAPLLSSGSATSTLRHPAATTSGTTSGTMAAAPLPRAGVSPRGG